MTIQLTQATDKIMQGKASLTELCIRLGTSDENGLAVEVDVGSYILRRGLRGKRVLRTSEIARS